jgi:nucleotide-binding universal stress UspA family protein
MAMNRPRPPQGPALAGPPPDAAMTPMRALPREPAARPGPALRLVERIVVPVEGTDREYVAQQWAAELAFALGVGVRAVHVDPDMRQPQQDLFRYVESECRRWGVPFESVVVHGQDVVEELTGELNARDLVVVGTRALASAYHLGSVAADLVRTAPCPVQILRIG